MKTTTALLLSGLSITATAKDWPMWGNDPTRNMVGESKELPKPSSRDQFYNVKPPINHKAAISPPKEK